jgi:hypothetical protein
MLSLFPRIVVGAAVVMAAAGCSQRPSLNVRGRAGADQIPALIDIKGAAVTSGFSLGVLREQRSLPSFQITKHPVTNAQYAACVQAGACSTSDGSSCGEGAFTPYGSYRTPNYSRGSDDSPAVCVGRQEAAAYCQWIGGRLPTFDQWLLAARGQTPKRYAWGNAATSCDQHPLLPQVIAQLRRQGFIEETAAARLPECPATNFDASVLAVGHHPAGASPSGIEDVMLTPGELLAGDSGSMFNACSNGSTHCVVFGMEPATIDSVETFFTSAKTGGQDPDGLAVVAHAYSFRCVLER